MTIITSIRAPLPVAEIPARPEPGSRQADTAAGQSAPVAAPDQPRAVAQPVATTPQFLATRTTVETSAAEAAAAARTAYIRASIAAGISPLPLS